MAPTRQQSSRDHYIHVTHNSDDNTKIKWLFTLLAGSRDSEVDDLYEAVLDAGCTTKTSTKVSKAGFSEEFIRRAKVLGIDVPNSKYWGIKKSVAYLTKNPLPPDDIHYFQVALKDIFQRMKQESEAVQLTIKKCDNYKLRYIECIKDDRIIDLLLNRTNSLDRDGLDRLGGPNADPLLHEEAAKL